jgi:hypothetical protein
MAALMLADGSSWIVCPRFNACRFSGPLDYSRTMVAITADLKTKVLALRRGPLLPFTAFMKFRGPQALKDTLRPACSRCGPPPLHGAPGNATNLCRLGLPYGASVSARSP